MMGVEIGAVGYGLACAVTWGAADFSGGWASRRGAVHSVIPASQVAGITLLAITALVLGEPVPQAGEWQAG